MFKKIILITIMFLLTTLNCVAQEVETKSSIALVQSLDTGEIYYDKNADMQTAPASLTKIMTALVTYEILKGQDLTSTYVEIVDEMLEPLNGTGATVMYFTSGMNLSVYDLLATLMMVSAADSAMALEKYVEEYTQQNFVDLMNQYAKAIGMDNTTFKNTTGLDANGQITTAFDMALLLKALSQNEFLCELMMQKEHTIEMWTEGVVYMKVQNRMLKSMDTLGSQTLQWGKTGYTIDAGYCLATFHNDGNHNFAVVVMKVDQDLYQFQDIYYDTHRLATYAQDKIHEKIFFQPNEVIHTIEVSGGDIEAVDLISKNLVYISDNSEANLNGYSVEYLGPQVIKAPIDINDEVGKLLIKKGDDVVKEMPLFANQTIERKISPGILVELLGQYWLIVVVVFLLFSYRSFLKKPKQNSGIKPRPKSRF